MKNMMKNLLESIIICSLLLFAISCSDTSDSVIKEQQIKTSSISFKSAPVEISVDEMLEEISDPKIQNAIKKFTNKGNLFRGEIQEEYFEKIELETYTNYSMNVKDVSEAEPYFLVLLITKSNDGIEKAGFLKYTPTNITDEFHIKTFSGSMQLLDLDFSPVVETLFDNGLYTSSTSMWSENCTTTTTIEIVTCSQEGGHGIGGMCNDGTPSDAYLSVVLNTICTYSYMIDYNVPSIYISGSGSLTNQQRFFNGLTTTQRNFLQSNPLIKETIIAYLERVSYTAGKTHAVWSINYLMTHPNVTIEKFNNWFLTEREKKDGVYDSAYWDDPNLSFPQQDLPSWIDFDEAYPRMNGSELVTLVGGEIEEAYTTYPSLSRGYCALKVSRALNYSGIEIPQITTTNGSPGTVQGADGKYYFLNAKALNKWMRETFGTNPSSTDTPYNVNHRHITGAEGGVVGENFPTLTANIKGIYSMVSTNSNWASGHADLIDNGECVFGCHFYDTPPAPIDYIDIWILE